MSKRPREEETTVTADAELLMAAKVGDLCTVRRLVEGGYASINGAVERVELGGARGGGYDRSPPETTPLVQAVMGKHWAVAEYILTAPAAFGFKLACAGELLGTLVQQRETPETIAVMRLVAHKATDPDTYILRDTRAIIVAAEGGKLAFIKALLDGGSKVDVNCNGGFTAFERAVLRGQWEAARFLTAQPTFDFKGSHHESMYSGPVSLMHFVVTHARAPEALAVLRALHEGDPTLIAREARGGELPVETALRRQNPRAVCYLMDVLGSVAPRHGKGSKKYRN